MIVLDVAILGGGLAGLTAAATVATPGRRVALYEALPRLGGLCGEFEHNGRVFVRACNEFGGGLADLMAELGAPVRFARSHALVALPEASVAMPPQWRDTGTFLRHASGVVAAVRAGQRPGARVLLDAVGAPETDSWVRSLAAFFAGTAATPPSRVALADLGALIRSGYAWHRPVKALGGPQAITRALSEVATGRGAALETGARAEILGRDGEMHVLSVGGVEVRARQAITSAPRWDAYPASSTEGLYYGVALVALRGDLAFPQGVTTVHVLPEDALQRVEALGVGSFDPTGFPFLLTRQLGDAPASGRTLVGYFAVPADRLTFTPTLTAAIRDHLVERGDAHVPGLARALDWISVLSPADFHALHGLWPRAAARVPPPGWTRPSETDDATDLHHVGVSVGPPGGDGVAAAFSGRRVGRRVAAILDADQAGRTVGRRPDAMAAR